MPNGVSRLPTFLAACVGTFLLATPVRHLLYTPEELAAIDAIVPVSWPYVMFMLAPITGTLAGLWLGVRTKARQQAFVDRTKTNRT